MLKHLAIYPKRILMAVMPVLALVAYPAISNATTTYYFVQTVGADDVAGFEAAAFDDGSVSCTALGGVASDGFTQVSTKGGTVDTVVSTCNLSKDSQVQITTFVFFDEEIPQDECEYDNVEATCFKDGPPQGNN